MLSVFVRPSSPSFPLGDSLGTTSTGVVYIPIGILSCCNAEILRKTHKKPHNSTPKTPVRMSRTNPAIVPRHPVRTSPRPHHPVQPCNISISLFKGGRGGVFVQKVLICRNMHFMGPYPHIFLTPVSGGSQRHLPQISMSKHPKSLCRIE